MIVKELTEYACKGGDYLCEVEVHRQSVVVHTHKRLRDGVTCNKCKSGWGKMTEKAKAALGNPCTTPGCIGRGTGVYVKDDEPEIWTCTDFLCNGGCGEVGGEQYSLGLYAGVWCDKCWESAPYRKDGPEGYSWLDAGEDY